MSSAKELPELVQEFVEMSTAYLKQETIEPAKQLGRFAGFGFAAAAVWALAALFLAIAGNRFVIWLLPDGPIWSALGYVISVLVIGIVIAVIVKVASNEH